MNKNVGQYLKELREKKHLSQNQLAEKLHISRSVIAKYETGEREPSFNNLIILSKFFKIPIADLIPIYEQGIKSNNTKDVLNYLLRQNKIFRTTVLSLVIALIMTLISVIIYICVLNYVSTKVYKVVSLEDSSIVKDGILVTTKDKLYLYLNNSIERDGVKEIKLYYLDGKDKSYVFSTTEINNLIFYADLNDDEYINSKNYKKFFNNSYLEIYYKDNKTKSIKITYKFDYTNNNLANDVGNVTMEVPSQTTEKLVKVNASNNNNNNKNKSELYDIVVPFMEKNDLETINIKIDGIKYEVSVVNKTVNIVYKSKGKKYSLSYTILLNNETLKLNDITSKTHFLYSANLTYNDCEGISCSNMNDHINLIKKIINRIK